VKRIAVLGAGAWGTALAAVLSTRHEVTLWARDAAQAERTGDDVVLADDRPPDRLDQAVGC